MFCGKVEIVTICVKILLQIAWTNDHHKMLNSFFQEHLSHLQLVSIIIIILTIIVIIIMMIILKKTLITKNIFYYYDKILKKSKNTLKCLVKIYEKLTNTRFVYVYFLNFKEG